MIRPVSFLSLLTCLLGLSCLPVSGEIVISEFMADNDQGLKDEDGEDPDWIEIANTGSEAVELGGFYLTDDATDLKKWKFPPTTLGPGSYLVVFASGKDRDPAGGELHSNFVLSSSGEYLALVDPDGVTVVHGFSPRYPTQGENVSFGMGLSGSVSSTDATPTWAGSVNYASMRISGPGAATANNSPNSFDNGSGASQTQMYMWLNLGEKLATLPSSEKKVVSAVLRWNGDVKTTNGGATVETNIGVYPVTDGQQGKVQIAETFSGDELVRYAAANEAVSSVVAVPGVALEAAWDVSELVQGWIDAGDVGAGLEVALVTDSRPVWIAWEKDGGGNPSATLEVVTTSALGNGLVAQYFESATPGETNAGGETVGPYFGEVTRHPEQPVAGDLTITAEVEGVDGRTVESVKMFFRKMQEAEQTGDMRDDGTGGDETAGDGVYTAVIPSAMVEPGMLVRWRFEATDSAGLVTQEPPFRDRLESNEYWGTVGHDPSIETNLETLHWFLDPRRVASAASDRGARAGFYYLGEYYDNVLMTIHGQSTRGGNFPKKSYNLDFNRTQNFRWHADHGRAKDMDILTNWADKSKVRHLLSWELMREAGVHAHELFTVRVQLNGEFYMLSDMIENGDADYLERAGLDPEGALYKIFNRFNSFPGDAGSSAEKKSRKWENNLDIRDFLRGVTSGSSATKQRFMWDHLDIPKTVNMLAARSLSGMTDFGHKNYYLYRDSDGTGEWAILPWDLDLSFGHHWRSGPAYFDDALYTNHGINHGGNNGVVTMMNLSSEVRAMVNRRLRTLMDVYVQPAGTPAAESWYHRRMDEQLALLDPAGINPSDADLDFMRWGSWSGASEARPGDRYRRRDYDDTNSQVRSMAEEIQRLKDEWIEGRRTYLYRQVGSGGTRIPQPQPAMPDVTFGALEFAPASGNQDEEYLVVENNESVWIDISGWKLAGGVEFTFEPGTVLPPNKELYVSPDVTVFRAREVSPKGGESHWVEGGYKGHLSSFGETVQLLNADDVEVSSVTYVGEPSDVQSYLAVTEIMYHPAELSEAEFIEVMNTSGDLTLDLTGVKFTDGVDFDFTGGGVTSLAPGARAVVVRNVAVFESVYGGGLPVAGAFANDSVLRNGGEGLKIEDAEGGTVKEFSYNDKDPWPLEADGGGFSLVLIDEGTNPDPGEVGNWRASGVIGGTPGSEDRSGFTGDPAADEDDDGVVALLEYFFGTSDTEPRDGQGIVVTESAATLEMVISFPRSLNAAGVSHRLEVSNDLQTWTEVDGGAFEGATDNGDGTETLSYKVPAGAGIYARVVVEG